MKFEATKIAGLYKIQQEGHQDFRGEYARTFCKDEFKAQGLNDKIVQINTIVTKMMGTIRGLHYQAEPHGEVKCLRCLRGSIYDLVVDMRPASATYGKWQAFELKENDGIQLYIPEGLAHGFQSLEDDVLVSYSVSQSYFPASERAVRWDDPALDLVWPISPAILSDKDKNHPNIVL